MDLALYGKGKCEQHYVDGVIKERFRDHDIRAKTASDTELDHAFKLLGHGDIKVTQQHYDRKARTVMPLG